MQSSEASVGKDTVRFMAFQATDMGPCRIVMCRTVQNNRSDVFEGFN